MNDHICEFLDSGLPVRITGTLSSIHRRVGARHVVLDGVEGRFEHGDDEHASPTFIRDPPRPEAA